MVLSMTEFLSTLSLFSIVLTLGTYQIGLWCRKKWDSPLCNPLLIAVILIIVVLLATGFPVEKYQSGVSGISWLLTPATVSLAIPLYQQLKVLKRNLPAILAGIVSGAIVSVAGVWGMCALFSLDHSITVSLLPKSITTAIGIVLAEQNGGIASLTAITIILTGVIGSIAGTVFCKLFKLNHSIAQGVAFGTATHVMGTTKANELGQLQGAVSSLSLVVAGIVTAVVFPLVCLFL